MRDRLSGTAIAAASAIAWALCFSRETSVWLGWVALVPWVVLLGHPRVTAQRALLLGLVHGAVFWVISVHWIAPTIHTFGTIPLPLAWFFLVLAALFLALHMPLVAVAARRFLKRGPVLTLLCLPAVWVVFEWIRGNLLGSLSFPWNLAAYAWVDVPGALPLAAWIGPWGISYLVVAVNVALALAWRARRPDAAGVAVLSALLVLAIAARFSGGLPGSPPDDFSGGGRPVSVVQPNRSLQADAALARRQYGQLLQLTRSECMLKEPTLVIWPESASWPHTWDSSGQLRRDLDELAARGCSVVLNTPTVDPAEDDAYFNSALLVGAAPPRDAAAQPGRRAVLRGSYHKRFLVPWGEHVPLGDVFPFIDKLARFAGRFSSGTEPGLLEWNGELFGLALCYEVVFPDGMAGQVRAGATLLVNISNDAWYGDTSAPRQLFRAARFRAAENRRTMLRAGLTGISGMIDPRGRVRSRLDLGQRGVLRERLRGRAQLTPYTRAPWLLPLISGILVILGFFFTKRT